MKGNYTVSHIFSSYEFLEKIESDDFLKREIGIFIDEIFIERNFRFLSMEINILLIILFENKSDNVA